VAFSCRRTPVWEGLAPRQAPRRLAPTPTRSHLVFYPGRDVEKPASIGKADAVSIPHDQPPSVERVPHDARHFGNVEACTRGGVTSAQTRTMTRWSGVAESLVGAVAGADALTQRL
jgi:hypothetical protein